MPYVLAFFAVAFALRGALAFLAIRPTTSPAA
jgi:hypothetical protein